jgi:zinc/manganese transport system substrate-binding protein
VAGRRALTRQMKAILAPALLGFAACAALAGQGEARPLRVVTLSTVLAEVAREVGGGEAEVVSLVRPGVDPHTFNPSPADVRVLMDADVVLASGLKLETYLDRLVASVGPKGRVVSVGDALPLVLSIPRAGTPGERDPHWWHSIDNMLVAVDLVRAELARSRPASAGRFARNALGYQGRLSALRVWALSEIAKVAPARRQLVTSHDAFGYFAHDYGFAVHSINGLSTESEADARHLAGLIDLIRREKVRAVFAESSANPRLVSNLLDETGVLLGGTLYADGLGPAGSGAETYEAMYRHNVLAIVGALAGP